MPLILVALILTASVFLSGSARGQSEPVRPSAEGVVSTPIGKIVSAKGSFAVEHVNAVIVQANVITTRGEAKVGDLVYKGDVVSTGVDGTLGVIFTDGTAFNLSKNARMVLNEFVYDPTGKSNSTLFTLSKGTFTFIAGKVSKTGDMKIDTPVATMGVRGTTPHVEISDDGKVAFSTLVEDKRAIEKLSAVDENKSEPTVKRRQAKSGLSPVTSTPPAEKKLGNGPEMWIDATFNINLKICRGC
jgi:hypothetical protein